MGGLFRKINFQSGHFEWGAYYWNNLQMLHKLILIIALNVKKKKEALDGGTYNT